MLTITVKAREGWDPETERFIELKKDVTLQLEHSLISVSRWEAKWKKPYIAKTEKDTKTKEEVKDYIRCMTVSNNIDPKVYDFLTEQNLKEITDYINDPMTATWFDDKAVSKRSSAEQITSELLYYYMVQYDIPWEAQKWHFNRLMTLIRVFSDKEASSGKKISKKDLLSRNSRLNKARRMASGSKG